MGGLGLDLLYAPTFASAAELTGVARAMAATGLPYALAPAIDAAGHMLDGSALTNVIRVIDGTVVPSPVHYLGAVFIPLVFDKPSRRFEARQWQHTVSLD